MNMKKKKYCSHKMEIEGAIVACNKCGEFSLTKKFKAVLNTKNKRIWK